MGGTYLNRVERGEITFFTAQIPGKEGRFQRLFPWSHLCHVGEEAGSRHRGRPGGPFQSSSRADEGHWDGAPDWKLQTDKVRPWERCRRWQAPNGSGLTGCIDLTPGGAEPLILEGPLRCMAQSVMMVHLLVYLLARWNEAEGTERRHWKVGWDSWAAQSCQLKGLETEGRLWEGEMGRD